jgi:hypothetical protein
VGDKLRNEWRREGPREEGVAREWSDGVRRGLVAAVAVVVLNAAAAVAAAADLGWGGGMGGLLLI